MDQPDSEGALNPAQRKVIELLGRGGDPTPLADGLADELRDQLSTELEPIAAAIPETSPLFVSKHALTTVHQCEAHHLAGDGQFEWSPPVARGVVAHRAIEIAMSWRGQPVPGDLVDETLARLADDDRAPVSRYIAGLSEFERAELRSLAVNHVTKFQECFPPLKPAWLPQAESRSYVDLCDGRLKLSGKVDLTLGRPGQKVIIDLKTGFPATSHREDLRFYALLETLRTGLAPRKLASYYLDSATAQPEDVSEAVLRVAVRRLVDGVERMVAIRHDGEIPARTAGPQCRWCPLAPDCNVGQAYVGDIAQAEGW